MIPGMRLYYAFDARGIYRDIMLALGLGLGLGLPPKHAVTCNYLPKRQSLLYYVPSTLWFSALIAVTVSVLCQSIDSGPVLCTGLQPWGTLTSW